MLCGNLDRDLKIKSPGYLKPIYQNDITGTTGLYFFLSDRAEAKSQMQWQAWQFTISHFHIC